MVSNRERIWLIAIMPPVITHGNQKVQFIFEQFLRLEIKNTDEEEYNRIIAIEKAVETFRRISQDKKFVLVNTLNESGVCFITLNDGIRMDCLVTAKEENGNWTVLTLDGETKQYPSGLVKQAI